MAAPAARAPTPRSPLSVFEAALLGLVQGLTEFLPVSSSGHLVLFGHLLGVGGATENVLFDVVLHVATLVAVLVVYARDAVRALMAGLRALTVAPRRGLAAFGLGHDDATEQLGYDVADARLALFVVLATIPTGIIAIAFKDTFEALFASPRSAAWALFGTAAILFTSRLFANRPLRERAPGLLDALIIGTVQGLAIIPGISRSGSTITAGLARGMSAEAAARASFLMSVPAILGALVLELRHVGEVTISPLAFVIGALVAFVSGTVAILLVLRLLKAQVFWLFGFYCVVAAVAGLLLT